MFFKCTCGCRALSVEKVADEIENITFGEIDIAMYHYGVESPTLWEKLRHCWEILRTGKNYPDEIVLSYSEAQRLGLELMEMTGEDNGQSND